MSVWQNKARCAVVVWNSLVDNVRIVCQVVLLNSI
jgi:hypothetical protein